MSEPATTKLSEQKMRDLAHELVTQANAAFATGRRFLLGLAGIPGSGKSTLAAKLVEQVELESPGIVRTLPMDGFHLSNQRLDELGLRSFKGSPATFDATAFIDLLEQARSVRGDERVPFPIYDRALHEPVLPSDLVHAITPATKLIITEGNYLLLDEDPWRRLAGVLDECWWLDTPLDLARQRIIARHVRGGRDIDDAMQHYGRTDLPNSKLVLTKRRMADRVLSADAP